MLKWDWYLFVKNELKCIGWNYIMLNLYIEAINVIFGLLTLAMLGLIISFMIKKQDFFRSILFLNGNKLKNPTIIISFGVILFVLKEIHITKLLVGISKSAILEELLELGCIILIFLGILIIFRLFISRIPINNYSIKRKFKGTK